MRSVYIAGPDVFRLDWPDFCDGVEKRCASLGILPIFPIHPRVNLDQFGVNGITTKGSIEDAMVVFKHCYESIKSADVVVANISPFRGDEPDSGTVFEMGLAHALGKPIIGYSSDMRTPVDRLIRNSTLTPRGAILYNGLIVEDFGLPANLMVSCTCAAIVSSVYEALDKSASC